MAYDIRVYTTPTCPWCKRVRQFLDENNISYKDYNIAADSAARNELLAQGYLSIPVIQVNDETIVGFNEPQLREKLHVN